MTTLLANNKKNSSKIDRSIRVRKVVIKWQHSNDACLQITYSFANISDLVVFDGMKTKSKETIQK